MLMQTTMMPADASTAPTAFAAWLRQAMRERSLSYSMLVRLVNEQYPDGRFAASSISHYLSGRCRPRPALQDAIERALGSRPPPREQASTPNPVGPPALAVSQDTPAPFLRVEDLGDGRA